MKFLPNQTKIYCSIAVAGLLFTSTIGTTAAAEPGWSPVVLPTGEYRAEIKAMPIQNRPYRPLHFYGNTVRRNYYRSNSPQSRVVVPRTVRTSNPVIVPFGG